MCCRAYSEYATIKKTFLLFLSVARHLMKCISTSKIFELVSRITRVDEKNIWLSFNYSIIRVAVQGVTGVIGTSIYSYRISRCHNRYVTALDTKLTSQYWPHQNRYHNDHAKFVAFLVLLILSPISHISGFQSRDVDGAYIKSAKRAGTWLSQTGS